jgi:hypothetical protein
MRAHGHKCTDSSAFGREVAPSDFTRVTNKSETGGAGAVSMLVNGKSRGIVLLPGPSSRGRDAVYLVDVEIGMRRVRQSCSCNKQAKSIGLLSGGLNSSMSTCW